ncbi:MAG: hypothetical protein PHP26_01630 [Syntrophomonas sp.]|nr:hypothetical protein [Syntrophomonas sp.]
MSGQVRNPAAFTQVYSETKNRVAAKKTDLTTRLFLLEPMAGFEPATC